VPNITVEQTIVASPETVRAALDVVPPELDAPWLAGLPVEVETDRDVLRVRARVPRRIVTYFWWAADPLIRRSVRAALRRRAAELAGAAPPPPSRFRPPAALTLHHYRTIGTLTFVLALVGYGAALFTQTIDFVARSFGASDAQLGGVAAITRVGTLAALTGTALADRAGRRRVIVWATALVCAATAACAAAPGLWSFGALQILVRLGANVAAVVAVIAITEEAPEGGRAFTIGVSGIAGSGGFALGSLLLPAADLHPQAWRGLYALAGLGLVFIPGLARRLQETARFVALAARGAVRGRLREVVDRTYGGRFGVLVAMAFLFNMSAAPSSQFANRYLGGVRGFSGFDILVLRTLTQTLTAIAATYLGGMAAETLGRRPAARAGLLILAAGEAAFYLLGGPPMWIALAAGTAAAAFAGPSLAAFNTELFPTEVRGTAGAGLLAAAVAGAVVGLVGAGRMAGALGGLGPSVALFTATPALLMVPLVRWLPEARGRDLDDISPPEV
jgi:MFS family permease